MMVILYSIMFAVMRGVFVIDHGIHWRSNRDRVKIDLAVAEIGEDKKSKAIANLMLLYVHLRSVSSHGDLYFCK